MTTPHRNNGFTFLEVLIALTILAVAGVGMVVMVNDSQVTLADSRRILEVSAMARAQLLDLERDGVTAITDRHGEFRDHPGLTWNARAYATDRDGYYVLRLTVGPEDSEEVIALVEKAFIER